MTEKIEIKGFEGYFIDKEGNVFNKKRKLKINIKSNGYCEIKLTKLGKKYHKYIHRLVLENFKGPGEGLECNHIDRNKLNNKLENLEWVTTVENAYHKHNTDGIYYKYHKEESLNKRGVKKRIYQLNMDGEIIKEWLCIRTAGRTLGIDSSCIVKCLKSKRAFTGGYKRIYGD